MAAIRKLPCKEGGLGLTSLVDISPVAWKCSFFASHDLIISHWDKIGHLWKGKVWEEENSSGLEDHLKLDNKFILGETTFGTLGLSQKDLTEDLFKRKADEV